MKSLLLLISIAFLASCNTSATVVVDGVHVETAMRLGGRGTITVQRGDLAITASDDNEDSFREGAKTVRFGIGAAELGSVARSGIAATRSIKNVATRAQVSRVSEREVTKRAAIAADVEKTRLTLPPIPIE